MANALDTGATRVRLLTSQAAGTLTVVDDRRGMKRRDLARYHDIASSTKARGEGIGFAGVGPMARTMGGEGAPPDTGPPEDDAGTSTSGEARPPSEEPVAPPEPPPPRRG